jgi:hypothetical protein
MGPDDFDNLMNLPPPQHAPVLRRNDAMGPADFDNLMILPPPQHVPVLRRNDAMGPDDFAARHNLNNDFMAVANVQNANNGQINVNQLNDYFYNLFQFAKNEQRARGHETLSWDNYRNRFYNTFLVSEKEKIMNDMREEISERYDHLYPKFRGYGFGKKKTSKKVKKSAKKVKKSVKKVKKSVKKVKMSVKKVKMSVKKVKKSIKKSKKTKRSLKK